MHPNLSNFRKYLEIHVKMGLHVDIFTSYYIHSAIYSIAAPTAVHQAAHKGRRKQHVGYTTNRRFVHRPLSRGGILGRTLGAIGSNTIRSGYLRLFVLRQP